MAAVKGCMAGKWITGVLAAAVTVISLGGCSPSGKNNEAPESDSAGTEAGAPISISFMMPALKSELPKDDSPVIRELNSYLHAKLHLEWVPDSTYDDKINITLASGKLPTLMVFKNRTPSFINAARSGAFWDLAPYLQDYPNLRQTNPTVLANTSIDGKVYGIYRSRFLGRYGIVYRKDWLDNLGLPQPRTIDDFYNMLKAFTTQDPDRNGKHDTYGMVITKYAGPFDQMQTWFGAPNKWGTDAGGKLTPDFMTSEYMDAMRFFKKLYDEKLINADFAVLDSAKWPDPVINGQAGVVTDVIDQAARIEDKLHQALEKAGKDDKARTFMDVMGSVEGPKGLRSLPTSGYSGLIAVTKTEVRTEQQLRQVLGVLDKLNDEKAQILAGNGIEGRHFVRVPGGIEATKMTGVSSEFGGLNQMLMFIPEDRELTVVQTDLRKKQSAVIQANEAIVVPNPAEPLISTVYQQKGPQLDNMIADARIKFIVGQIDEAGFKQTIEQWRKSGGDDYIREINELYAKSKK